MSFQKILTFILSISLLGCVNNLSEPTQKKSVVRHKNSAEISDAPASKFDLLGWTLSVPIDSNGDGKSDQIKEKALAAGYFDKDFFYLTEDGGMRFKAPIKGAKTSKSTSYTRSELREMIRRGDTQHKTQGVGANNWVFSTAPATDLEAAGAIDGSLAATLKIDHVTTTGLNRQVGRVIVGQIHANDDEPVRLYYHKLPDQQKGVIYFAHEPRVGDEIWINMVGQLLPKDYSKDSQPAEPEDGIALGETFSYLINVTGNILTVTIIRSGKANISKQVDMSRSKYDAGGQYMYFKAGVYNQNKTGEATDYVQATFYNLAVSH